MKRLFILMLVFAGISLNTIKAQTQLTADIYASYFGGSSGEYNIYITADREGNVILAGHTYSTNLLVSPVNMPGPHNVNDENPDGFIAKFTPDMNEVIFSLYLGGTSYDEIKSVTVDSMGNIYVTGLTSSDDFPVTENAYDTAYNGNADAFLTKLGPDGGVLYSTFFGGDNYECGYGILTIDTSTIWVTGTTSSTNIPLQSQVQDENNGEDEIFLMKINILSNTLQFSTYFGGNANDNPNDRGIAMDKSGDIYICGYTTSSDFLVKNAFDSTFNGNRDGFITKFSKNGELIYSSFIGGSEDDELTGIEVNDNNEAYFIGASSSSGLICSDNAFSSIKKADSDIILGKVNEQGDSLLYFSYFGGNNYDNYYHGSYQGYSYSWCYGKLHCISDDKIFITGTTASTDFIATDNAIQTSRKGPSDIFVSILNIAQKDTLYFTYFGGSGDEMGFDLSVLNDSTFYISASSGSTDFPVSLDAFRRNISGGGDAVFARFISKEYLPTVIKPAGNQNEIKIYPNPTSGEFTIFFGIVPVKTSKVVIYTPEGRQVYSETFYNKTKSVINLTDFSPGIYFVMCLIDNDIVTKKICVR